MLVLGLDTTGNYIGISIINNTDILIELLINEPCTENLIPKLENIFFICEFELKQLEGVCVVTGPGTYTGIRTGIAIAKTISQTLSIPIIGADKLSLLLYEDNEYGVIAQNAVFSPLLDIKRQEVYTALAKLYTEKPDYIIKPGIYKIKDWLEHLIKVVKDDEEIIFIGSGAKIYTEIIKKFFPKGIINLSQDSPSKVARLGYMFFKNGTQQHFMDIKPFYLREPGMFPYHHQL